MSIFTGNIRIRQFQCFAVTFQSLSCPSHSSGKKEMKVDQMLGSICLKIITRYDRNIVGKMAAVFIKIRLTFIHCFANEHATSTPGEFSKICIKLHQRKRIVLNHVNQLSPPTAHDDCSVSNFIIRRMPVAIRIICGFMIWFRTIPNAAPFSSVSIDNWRTNGTNLLFIRVNCL